jgi:hypothetical protein
MSFVQGLTTRIANRKNRTPERIETDNFNISEFRTGIFLSAYETRPEYSPETSPVNMKMPADMNRKFSRRKKSGRFLLH